MVIAANAVLKENENDAFKTYLQPFSDREIDEEVNRLNETVTPQIDCLACAGCCNSLMVEVTEQELSALEIPLNKTSKQIREEYIETGLSGKMLVNQIPCAFLTGKACSIYENRFAPCHDFPHLHQKQFKSRLFSTFMYYGTCPIIYNVVEELKSVLHFHMEDEPVEV